MRARLTPLSGFVLIGLSLAAACGSKPAPAPAAAGGGKKVDSATVGAITGRVVFDGTPPAREVLRVGVDQECVKGSGPNPQSDAVLVGPGGALQNVFVYVKDGLDPAYSFDTPTTPVQLDQKGCHYSPRIFGVRAGQPIELMNSDATLHNVHALPMANSEFNTGAPVQGWRMTHVFTVPEVMVRFKCDVHGWMAAYVGVMAHPFFAVSAADGTFDIKGLPPGTYTIAAWHEKFGTRTAQVTVGEHQMQNLTLTFSAATK
jgi:plastocyanin